MALRFVISHIFSRIGSIKPFVFVTRMRFNPLSSEAVSLSDHPNSRITTDLIKGLIMKTVTGSFMVAVAFTFFLVVAVVKIKFYMTARDCVEIPTDEVSSRAQIKLINFFRTDFFHWRQSESIFQKRLVWSSESMTPNICLISMNTTKTWSDLPPKDGGQIPTALSVSHFVISELWLES